jgi:hypothetical protein
MRVASKACLVAFLLLLASGCSSASGDPGDGGKTGDARNPDAAAKVETGALTGDAPETGASDARSVDSGDAGATGEASADAPAVPDAPTASSGSCASCTAMSCLSELEACAGDEGCTDALVAFNDCFTTPTAGGACGATLSGEGSTANALWACMSTSCKGVCD